MLCNIRRMDTLSTFIHGLASFQIKVDGSAIADEIEVGTIDVLTCTGEAQRLTLTVLLSHFGEGLGDDPGREFPLDRSVVVEAGHDGNNRQIFRGAINTVRLELGGHTVSRLVIEASGDVVTPTTDASVRYTAGIDVEAISLALPGPTGTVTVQGQPGLVPGTSVRFKGFGSHFDGTQSVLSARHLLTEGRYTCELETAA